MVNWSGKLLRAALVLGLSAGTLAVGTTTADAAITATPLLSAAGEDGIGDLRECLASESQLDVYYLMDASGSLADTDPGIVRADLIANSLRELGTLRDDLELSYAVGFFGTDFVASIPWTTVETGSVDSQADRVRKAIRNQDSLGWTNWAVAVSSAQKMLVQRASQSDGCQAMVWLTDGGINLSGSVDGADDDAALNDLCGAQIRPGGQPRWGLGPFNELRQSGVVVIAVLLQVPGAAFTPRDVENAPYMRALVEGAGEVRGSQVTCGEYPLPEGYVSGVHLEASSAADLALVFLQLGTVVSGGFASPFNADGTFDVDAGISQFAIVTGSRDWRLTSPNGETISAGDAAGAGFTLDESGGASRITVAPRDAGDVGRWSWESTTGGSDNLYFFGGLVLELDEPATFLAGADNTLRGRILRDDDRVVPLDAYDFRLTLATATASGSQSVSPDAIEFDPVTGEFAFHYAAAEASGELLLEAALVDVTTRPSQTPLAPVTARRAVVVTLPAQYPTLSPSSLQLSELVGADGAAEGIVTVLPPADGGTGRVCFPEGLVPTVVSDSADRAEGWAWSVDVDGECLEVDAEVDIAVSAANRTAANSEISAVLPVRYESADGGAIEGELPIEFSSSRPLDAWAFGASFLLLLLAGLALPLVLLWLLNWWTSRINRGANLRRAQIPASIAADGRVYDRVGEPLIGQSFGSDVFKFQPNEPDARTVTDPALGTIRARVSLNPFGTPWAEIVPADGRAILGPAGFLPASRRSAQAKGAIAGFNGDMGAVWGFVAPAASLAAAARGDERVPGTLVVWTRMEKSGPTAFDRRVAEVLSAEPLRAQLTRLRGAFDSHPAPTGGAASAAAPAVPGARSRATDSSAPPAPRHGQASAEPPPPSSRRGVTTRDDSPPAAPSRGVPPAGPAGGASPSAPPSAVPSADPPARRDFGDTPPPPPPSRSR